MFSIYIFEDHAIIALANRQFANVLDVRDISVSDINNIHYVEYNDKMIKVYVPSVSQEEVF